MRVSSATYERAFEQYLRDHQLPYLAISQHRRPLAGGRSLKNFDFLVRSRFGQHYLVEVKGRQVPYVNRGRKVFWENWIHQQDLEGLRLWRDYFGFGFTGLICYTYLITEERYLESFSSRARWRGRTFGLVGLTLETFLEWGEQRSPRWRALHIPPAEFRQLICPVETFFLAPG